MLRIICTLLLSFVVLVTALNQHRDIDIIEDGMLIQQTITQYDDLQVFEVPQHGNRPHIIAYLDFQSGLQLIKDVKNQKCQLSNMEERTKIFHPRLLPEKPSGGAFSLPEFPIDASQIEKLHIFKLEQQETIQNTSHLRTELRQACVGLPIHWADSIDENHLNDMTRNGEILYDRAQNTLLRPMNPEAKISRSQTSCNPNPSVLPTQYFCHGMCFYQKCRMMSDSCFYFVTCAMNGVIGQTCMSHNIHMQGQCKPCCNDPKAPCQKPTDGMFQRCDCLTW